MEDVCRGSVLGASNLILIRCHLNAGQGSCPAGWEHEQGSARLGRAQPSWATSPLRCQGWAANPWGAANPSGAANLGADPQLSGQRGAPGYGCRGMRSTGLPCSDTAQPHAGLALIASTQRWGNVCGCPPPAPRCLLQASLWRSGQGIAC